jgi:hypothetical protein
MSYQKLKKSRTSFSEVAGEMPETWTVAGADIVSGRIKGGRKEK